MGERKTEIVDQNNIKTLQEENGLLLDQLHLVQEELEKYYLRNQELEAQLSSGGAASSRARVSAVIDENVLQLVAHKIRLDEQLVMQKEMLLLEQQQSPQARVGKIFVDAHRSGASAMSVFKELLALRRVARQKTPPTSWGGESFSKLIDAFDKGGLSEVDSLVFESNVAPFTKANAYRAVAEHARHTDAVQAVEAAYRAFRLHPMPYRQKWLAWRLADAGEVIKADALLESLSEASLTENDKKRASDIRARAIDQSETLARDLIGYEKERNLADADNTKSQEEIITLQKELAEQQKQRAHLIDSHTDERQRLQEQLSEAQSQLASLSVSHAVERNALQQEVSGLQRSAATLIKDQASAQRSFQHELAGLKQELGEVKDTMVPIAKVLLEEGLAESLKPLEKRFKAQSDMTVRQIESFLTLQTYLETGRMLGEMHGWPISPDFGLYLIEILEQSDYDAVLEFGSGISTLVLAKGLKKKGERLGIKHATYHLTFEHLEKYFENTRRLLSINGLQENVDLCLVPLIPFTDVDNQAYSYYNCRTAIKNLSEKFKGAAGKVLLVVDGPPGSTNQHARYPALPMVLEHLHGTNIDIVMDDYARVDEKEISEKWCNLFDSTGYTYTTSEAKLYKGALFIQAAPSKGMSGDSEAVSS